jgi:hypothetical protein
MRKFSELCWALLGGAVLFTILGLAIHFGGAC